MPRIAMAAPASDEDASATRVDDLIQRGRSQGHLSLSDLRTAFEQAGLTPGEARSILRELSEAGVRLADEETELKAPRAKAKAAAPKAAGARAYRIARRNGPGSFAKAPSWPPLAKTQSVHSQRRTAVMASENVTAPLPSQTTPGPSCASAGSCSYHSATTLYNPNWHGSARPTVRAHQPRVLSNPR